MLPVDVLEALRDSEKDLANWRRSPLRPLIEELMNKLDDDTREEMETQINAAQEALSSRGEVSETGERITRRLVEIVGEQHATDISLGVAPTRIDALLRGLRLLIDDGARGVGEASLGTANLIFLALGGRQGSKENALTTILTTHSPHIASVSPIRSVVLLQYDPAAKATKAVSTAKIPLTAADEADFRDT